MKSETTEHNDVSRGEVFYDAECPFCQRGARLFGPLFARRGFRRVPMQTPGTPERLGISEAELRREMKLLNVDGKLLSGIDAWICLLRSVWWLWPVGTFLQWPGIHRLAETAYRWLARNRYCFGKSCSASPPHSRHKAFFELP